MHTYLLEQTQQHVRGQCAFMCLVQNNDTVSGQEGFGHGLAQKHTIGHVSAGHAQQTQAREARFKEASNGLMARKSDDNQPGNTENSGPTYLRTVSLEKRFSKRME